MTTKPILLLMMADGSPYTSALAAAGLEDRFEVAVAPLGAEPSADVLARTEVLVTMGPPAGMLARMPRLKWVQSLTVGVDHWLARPDLGPDHVLTAARGTHRVQMPENILGALFHITKPYHAAALDQRESKWARKIGVPLAGKTLAILGLGAVGVELARKAEALELTVIGSKRSAGPVAHVQRVYAPEETDEMLARADFVVLLLPLTAATDSFMNAERLARMRKDAWLLNFGRGGLIDDEALIRAVESGTIAGAVLDVFRTEPLPATHPFWTTKGITVLPHIGGLHPTRDHVVAELVVRNARHWSAGRPLEEVVDRARGY
jgi:glyoxylate/hydroxypyruvate reductase A